ncbi:Macrocin-O-methyltransferase (TylF) [Allopseudospirillum japonicum]|uniref:Macrocin-O-methyltransferase (TylF) n=1 Tax=Allopseudospirillum japonicum TaxID=64971 RepID=A0A1H6UFP6_9GAMM|nr:class I SAM-dependent methyltransferase [Allopseudospirillum japonicum]SEI86642.1 Macrocin-O-methyltransferase (TylF) [Allopseudospirillum japonicum]
MKTTDNQHKVIVGSTNQEVLSKEKLANMLRTAQIPDTEILDNLGLFITRQNLARINFIQSLYEKIIPIHGVVMEFGVRWGQNMALFSALRGMLEPYNYNRKIIGFDTFSGFPSVDEKDGNMCTLGAYSVSGNWEQQLDEILDFHNQNAPIAHKKKFELVKGDASNTLPNYLQRHPETIVALAYFDFDIYEPTKNCLQEILPHLTKGSILAFDELNCPEFPGETLAVKEVLGLQNFSIRRSPLSPLTSYIVIE